MTSRSGKQNSIVFLIVAVMLLYGTKRWAG